MPRALVTGATGLIGSHIVERLLADGWKVRALVRRAGSSSGAAVAGGAASPAWLRERGVELAPGDVLDGESFARAAAGCGVIFHTAAVITPRGGWQTFRSVNVEGTRHAIDAAARAGARLLQLSSVAVYGHTPRRERSTGAIDESAPLLPLPERAFYARSKRESEEIALGAHRAGRIWATAVRPCVVYGPRDRQFVPRIGRLVSTGFAPRIGTGESTFAVVHAANVADGAVRAATHDAAGGQSYNLANDFPVTAAGFFHLAGEGIGRRVRLVPVPEGIARVVLTIVKSVGALIGGGRMSVVAGNAALDFLSRDDPYTSERARRELGWTPSVRPEVGVPDAFRWWKDHR